MISCLMQWDSSGYPWRDLIKLSGWPPITSACIFIDKSLPFPALGSSHSVKCLDNNCSTRQQGRPPRKALDVSSSVRLLGEQSSWESPWNLLFEAIPVTVLTWLWQDFSPCLCSLFAGSQHNLQTNTSWALVSLWELTLHGWLYHCNFFGGV